MKKKLLFRVMRLLILFWVVGLLHVSAVTRSQTVTIKGQSMPLAEVFNEVRKQTGIGIYGFQSMFKDTHPVTVDVKDMPVTQFLHLVLENQPIEAKIEAHGVVIKSRKRTPVWKSNSTTVTPSSQQVTITGLVTDDQGAPLDGVTVTVKGTSVRTTTDATGAFQLTLPSDARILVFSSVGFNSNELLIGTHRTFQVIMTPQVSDLDEVIVVGYGTQRKRDVTGSIARLDAEKLTAEATSNMADMLRGSLPGLTVSRTTNPKGLSNANQMLIRGQTSMTSNAPLIVVDGMIYYGDLANINPADIATFDILKDASSAAIYGARATNGVILITTKKGVKGPPTIHVNSQVGFATLSPDHYRMMNGDQFIRWRIAGYESTGRRQIESPGFYDDPNRLPAGVTVDQWKAYDGSTAATDLIDVWLNRIGFSPLEIENYQKGQTVDFFDKVFQRGIMQDYNISVGGGGSGSSYYTSVGYTKNEGIIYNDTYESFRARINLEYDVTPWLKVGTNTLYAMRDESPVPAAMLLTQTTPYSSFYDEQNGTIMYVPRGTSLINSQHPWLNLTFTDRFRKYDDLNTKVYGLLTLPFGITFTTEFNSRRNWGREYIAYSDEHPEWATLGGRASRANTSINEWQINNLLKWNKRLGDHYFDVTLGQNAEKYRYWFDFIEKRQFTPNDNLGYHNIGAGAILSDARSNDEVSTADALLARVNYSLFDRYTITGTFRRDGYSAFGQNQPRANFGSIAGAWILSDEPFFPQSGIDLLKLRASYGVNGNRGVGIYDALANVSAARYLFVNDGTPQYVTRLIIGRMGNRDLRWERTAAYNFGLDFGIWGNRLTGSLDGYFVKTTDLLIPRQLPDVTGYGSVFSNLGQVNNTGVELLVEGKPVVSEQFSWNAVFSLAHNRNKIVHLYGDYITDENGVRREIDDISNGWFIGKPIDQIWDYRVDGIWQVSEAETASRYARAPGDFKLWDANGDGYYTNDDKQFLGVRRPPYQLTFRNELRYGNWELSFKLYAYLGQYAANNHRKNADVNFSVSSFYNVPYWTPDQPSNTWARIGSYASGFNIWERNSFVRLDNAVLTYQLPSDWLARYHVSQCRISLNCQNIMTFSGWSWMDPETATFTPSFYSLKLIASLK